MNGLLVLLLFMLFLFAILAFKCHLTRKLAPTPIQRTPPLPQAPAQLARQNALKSAMKPPGSAKKPVHVAFASTRDERIFKVDDRSIIGDSVGKT